MKRRDCRHRLQFRWAQLLHRRDMAREMLRMLASGGMDPFTLWQAASRMATGSTRHRYEWITVAEFLRDHRFFQPAELRYGKRYRYELSEQAIRWLDWSGFNWKARRVA